MTTGSIYIDGILLVILLVPLSFTSDLKFLSKYSAMGIFVLISVQITLATTIMTSWTSLLDTFEMYSVYESIRYLIFVWSLIGKLCKGMILAVLYDPCP